MINNSDDDIKKQNYINLETFRKNGEGVKTPVWFVQDGNVFYVQTDGNSGKVKRIRRNTKVKIAPCKGDGRLLGDWIEARAEICQDVEKIKEVDQLAMRKYGWMKKMFNFFNVVKKSVYTTLMIKLN